MTNAIKTEEVHSKKITWIALLIFFISCLFFSYTFTIQVIPSVISRDLIHDFVISTTTFGIFSSSFYWLYTSTQIPAGLLIDRFGSRITLTIATFICGLGTVMFGLTHSIDMAIFGRVLEGIGATFAYIGIIYLIVRWFPPAMLATFIGILMITASIGAICGESVIANMVHHHSWRTIVTTSGFFGIMIALIIWLIVKDHPTHLKNNIPKKQKPEFSMPQSIYIILSNPQTWYIALFAFCIWGPSLAFAALWGIPFLKTSLHIDTLHAANAIALIWIGIGLGSPLVGWLSDKIKRRCLPLIITALLGLITMCCVIYIPHLPRFMLYIMLFAIGIALSAQSLTFAVIKDNNPTDIISTANGFNNMAVVLSGVMLQPFIGKLLDMNFHGTIINGIKIYQMHNYLIAFSVLPICFLIAAIMGIFFIKETHCKSVYNINLIRKKISSTATLQPSVEDLSIVYNVQHSIKHFYF
jgi:sugar phosphate permease